MAPIPPKDATCLSGRVTLFQWSSYSVSSGPSIIAGPTNQHVITRNGARRETPQYLLSRLETRDSRIPNATVVSVVGQIAFSWHSNPNQISRRRYVSGNHLPFRSIYRASPLLSTPLFFTFGDFPKSRRRSHS